MRPPGENRFFLFFSHEPKTFSCGGTRDYPDYSTTVVHISENCGGLRISSVTICMVPITIFRGRKKKKSTCNRKPNSHASGPTRRVSAHLYVSCRPPPLPFPSPCAQTTATEQSKTGEEGCPGYTRWPSRRTCSRPRQRLLWIQSHGQYFSQRRLGEPIDYRLNLYMGFEVVCVPNLSKRKGAIQLFLLGAHSAGSFWYTAVCSFHGRILVGKRIILRPLSLVMASETCLSVFWNVLSLFTDKMKALYDSCCTAVLL